VGAAPKDGPSVSLSVAQSDFSSAQDVSLFVASHRTQTFAIRLSFEIAIHL
jgi:hypothetical protein